ncbi:hypothetical protein RMATCC62417_15316 [Rhizopus microsporus]|nr:hypothetical protein RMATCC62417_15316 [Rhizopus microsporus]
MEEYQNGSSMFGKKRVRATQACILCRKKKIKCDGTKPHCLHCQESNLNCEYTESKKRGPRKGYVQLLEDRLAQLERRLTVATNDNLMDDKKEDLDNDFPEPEIVTHLIDLFFQYINSVFPFVHRGRLKQSIANGTVSKPLLWSVMAIAARFSDHPSIRTDPPYWAGERYAMKATSLINASLLEPTIANLQFWGIMSCLEYGRASGSKAWTYGGIAVRMCQELGLHKEETLKAPITAPDGTLDYVAMALRRRIFWSCFCIDKFSSTSTNRPQGFEIGDYDVRPPTVAESKILRDPLQAYTVDKVLIDEDPLMDSIGEYLSILEIFGDIAKYMSRAKTDYSSVIWPPIKEHEDLNRRMEFWATSLSDIYKFTPDNVKLYRETASENYINFWLCSHAIYCAGMLSLHRGSLAYSDLSSAEIPTETYERIQASIASCKTHVDIAMEVFSKLRDFCGCNVLPYMGYAAYIFATVLMTSTFSSDPILYNRSSKGLAVLFDTIKLLRPYWPVGERLALTTQDMLAAHSRLYDVQEQEENQKKKYEHNLKQINSPAAKASSVSSTDTGLLSQPMPIPATSSELAYPPAFIDSNVQPYYNQQQPPLPLQQQQQQQLGVGGNEIDFSSSEFLYDSALFGQMILDTSKPPNMTANMFSYYPPASTSASTTTTTTSTSNTPYPIVTPMYHPTPYSAFSYQQPPHH